MQHACACIITAAAAAVERSRQDPGAIRRGYVANAPLPSFCTFIKPFVARISEISVSTTVRALFLSPSFSLSSRDEFTEHQREQSSVTLLGRRARIKLGTRYPLNYAGELIEQLSISFRSFVCAFYAHLSVII